MKRLCHSSSPLLMNRNSATYRPLLLLQCFHVVMFRDKAAKETGKNRDGLATCRQPKRTEVTQRCVSGECIYGRRAFTATFHPKIKTGITPHLSRTCQ